LTLLAIRRDCSSYGFFFVRSLKQTSRFRYSIGRNKQYERSTTIGYTHYVHQKIWDKKDADGYLAALPILKQIAEKHKKIIQFESDDKGYPQVNAAGIHLNG